ncbi:aspartyl/asparaginyl beta-hydroxylase domain-containing protein [Sphingomonas cavernae]|uniref:Aspartyl/asparaginyl beta-hydroxylase domain-containing protein n=1 Tax=Sphingomonas cavernae TaxID=2320861 RepID=A0A418WQ55_9SPHN|nr:aspartyl/asparaginyl beta-hydroxylase domain-containing protein [Sphingomonas cavernae]RJF93356.1 aspartyl/asparaginyl beta-hydroxylase domain-containing protein [Sphingomonas cavernae]
MSAELPSLLAEADRASVAQDFVRAQALLRQAANARPDDASIFLKLAGVSRAAGEPRVALDAIHRALAISPLDFTALLMKASLLDRIGDPSAGEAWGHALAQKPDGDLPPQIAAVLAQGALRHAAWLDAREDHLKAAMTAVEARAEDEERGRIARFRSNVLRRTRHFHSEPTHFQFPGLSEREFHPRRLFPWLAELEAATDVIAAELEAVMAAERAELVPYIQYADHQPLRQWQPLNHNPDWTAIHLWQNGRRIEPNARHCPRTLALLERFHQPAIPGASPNAMFSLLAPGTAIPPHVGVSNARLICHLPLVVPEGCWFRVGAETRHWRRGEAFVFDDTIEHEAMNPSDQLRVVFIFDLWHPDLSEVEREAVTALITADGGAPAAGL